MFFIFIFFFREYELNNNFELVSFKILSISKGVYKNQSSFKCEGYYNNEIKIVYLNSNVQKVDKFIGKNFTVVYSATLNIGEILITPEDFEKHKIPFPDSLNWVLEYRY